MLQIQKMYQDVKNIVKWLPKDTRINRAIQQISMHLRVSALIAGTVRFQSGVRDTSPVSQLPFPVDTGVLKEPVVHKRKSATTTTDTQETSVTTIVTTSNNWTHCSESCKGFSQFSDRVGLD